MNKPSAISFDYAERPYRYPAATNDSDELFSPQRLIGILRRRSGIFVATAVAVFLAVAVATFQMTPVFSATASIIIDPRETQFIDLEAVVSGLPPDSAVVDTEVEIIRSRSLAEKIVNRLELMDKPEFNGALRPRSFTDKAKGAVRGFINSLSPPPPQPADDPWTPERKREVEREAVVSTLLGRTSARRIGTTYGIAINARSEDPLLATAIANAIADQYLVEQLDAKFDATRRANAWLEERLADLRQEVNEAEGRVEAYRSAENLFAAPNEGGTLNEQQIADINGQLVVQEGELAERQARLSAVTRQLAQGATAETSAEVLNSVVISDLRRQQAELVRERADLETRYGPRHPSLQRVLSEEADLEQQIRAEMDRIVTSLESEVAISQQRVGALRSSLAGLRTSIASNNRAMVRLRELERNAEASRTIYEAFLARFKQTNEQEGLTEADARVLSRAAVPLGPSFPRKGLNLALGLILGFGLGAVAVLLAESFDNQLSAGDEIESAYNVPFLGNFPKLHGRARRAPATYLVENPMSAYAEAFRNLRASIMFADLDTTVRTVAVTSSQPDEGKTTITLGLGRISAASGTKTIVIDGDFRRKQLTETSGIVPEAGFLECLFGEATLEEAIHEDSETGLHILPLTPTKHTPRDVFGSRAYDKLIEELKTSYDLIVIDTGPVLLMAETRVLAGKSDQVVVISRWRKTTKPLLRQTLNVLGEFKSNIAGVVLNQVDMNRYHRHGYGGSNYSDYEKYYMSG